MDISKKEILKGIHGYSHEQTILLRLIRKSPNGLSDEKFDKLFFGFKETMDSKGNVIKTRRPPKLRFYGFLRESFMLGNLSPSCEWEKWLHLLQLMCKAGLVKRYQEDGHVIYKTPGIMENNP